MSITAPYNFVPLSRFVFLPNWANQVSHDVPFHDGVSGSLKVQLTCETATLVGGKQTKATDQAPGRVEFFKDPNGFPVIPGSTIKGMLSNIIEIASFAKFNRLDDKRYSVRDLSAANNFYLNEFSGSKASQAGWLHFDKNSGQWRITPCKMARIYQGDIIDHLNIQRVKWTAADTIRKRYENLDGIRTIAFNTDTHKTKGTIAKLSPQGEKSGRLVVTGQPGQAFDKGTTAKKWEFVFYDQAELPTIVSPKVMQDFLFVHSESDEWRYWMEKDQLSSQDGVPVFYQQQNNKISSLGLAYLYRLAYHHSTHETVKHTQTSHIDSSAPDLPSLMFGYVDERTKQALKGRVNIGAAKTDTLPSYADLPATVLNGPKPSYYPAYIRQPNADLSGQLSGADKYHTMMDKQSEVSGWKRYPVHHKAVISTPKNGVGQDDNNKIKVALVPVEEGTQFSFTIRFHNLREAELGALLWSLTFGDKPYCFHNIGMGKPYGLGRVSLALLGCQLTKNSPSDLTQDAILDKAKRSFKQVMTEAYSSAIPDHNWLESAQLKELVDMAIPDHSKNLNYMPLGQFSSNKSSNESGLNVLNSSTGEKYTHPKVDNDKDPIRPHDEQKPNMDLSLLSDADYKQQLTNEQNEKAVQEAADVTKTELDKKIADASEKIANAKKEDTAQLIFEKAMLEYTKESTGTRKKAAEKSLEALIKKVAETNKYQPNETNDALEKAQSAGLSEKLIKKFIKAINRGDPA